MSRSCRRALVAGRVQGVAFRGWTQRAAEGLALDGWVRNLADGRVQVHVEGEEGAVEELLSRLRDGPAAARVTGVEVRAAGEERRSGFEVLPTAQVGE